MGGASARRKGHDFERKIAAQFRENGIEAERNLEYQSNHKGDINTPSLPFFWQLKCQKNPSVYAAIHQAIEDNPDPDGLIPVSLCKRTRDLTIVSMRWEDFFELVVMPYADRQNLLHP